MDEDEIYSEVCRLCLQESGSTDLFENEDLVLDVLLCTGVRITYSSHLPRKICSQCLETVKSAKQLRILVEANELRIRNIFASQNNSDETDETQNLEENVPNVSNSNNDPHSDFNGIPDGAEDTHYETVKRRRSSSPEKSKNEVMKKIAVRKDLLISSQNVTSPGKDYKYIEGTKYGISKNYTVTNNADEVAVTYTCGLCPKSFPTWKKVYCHQRSHNKTIVCTVDGCGKKFATKGDVEKHMRTHTGERPFKCPDCTSTFTQRCSLRAHYEALHES
ncbi:uncharacterized protein LOC142981850 [Anticarsia gemmatalis]|uniref:uncharacterized protein LOC142981850 n=1 Tax=Anticarsia gemmatalis TaxID=129554 RepID=UPI003F75BD5D